MSERVSEMIRSLDGANRWDVFGGDEASIVQEYIPDYFAAKGFSLAAIRGLAKEDDLLGRAVDSLLLGNQDSPYLSGTSRTSTRSNARATYLNTMTSYNYAGPNADDYVGAFGNSARQAYDGTHNDNLEIMNGVSRAAKEYAGRHGGKTQREFRRNGASRNLWGPDIDVSDAYKSEKLSTVPVAIVGCGASGILSAAYLYDMGFKNVTVFDKRGRSNGIWAQENVAGGTKNNPFEISFLNQAHLLSARNRRDLSGSGRDIEEFLTIISGRAGIVPRKANVKAIKPGDLNHEITFEEDGITKTESFPIVIYAPGNGEPLDPNDPARMTTPMKKNEVGQRWQRQLNNDEIQKIGKRAVLIGLGNSTAEVVHQLQQSRSGVDYRILTHHSLRSLLNPSKSVDNNPPIYRDINQPQLTSLAGDLEHIEQMFTDARDQGKIVPNVRSWHHDGNLLTAVDGDGIETRIPFDKLFTLIGYGQNPRVNGAMGLKTVDKRTGAIDYDFDGEVQRTGYDRFVHRSRRRIHPGYFALGGILKTANNPNALVIPGIQYQLQFLASTLLFRAAEVAYGSSKRRPKATQNSIDQ